MHCKTRLARIWTFFQTKDRQTAWVMMGGAIVWGLAQPDRAFVMTLYAGISAFYLYRLSWDEPTNRPFFLVLAGLMLGGSFVLRPGLGAYDADVSLLASFGREAFRILCEVAAFYIVSVGIMILRRSFLTGTRFGVLTSSPKLRNGNAE